MDRILIGENERGSEFYSRQGEGGKEKQRHGKFGGNL